MHNKFNIIYLNENHFQPINLKIKQKYIEKRKYMGDQ